MDESNIKLPLPIEGYASSIQELEAEFLSRVSKTPTCWEWIGKTTPNGYGYLFTKATYFFAHRLGYQLYVGKIPKGLVIDHLCMNKLCVNPDHLEAVTQAENNKRYWASLGEEYNDK